MSSRNTLKGYFAQGSFPTAAQFGELIDSILNITEDTQLKDQTAAVSIDYNARTLQTGSAPVIDWGNRKAFDSSNKLSINWQTRGLFDANGIASVEYDNRSLVNSDNNIVLNWSPSVPAKGIQVPNGMRLNFTDAAVTADSGAAAVTKITNPGTGSILTNTAGPDLMGMPDKWLFLATQTKLYKIPLYFQSNL